MQSSAPCGLGEFCSVGSDAATPCAPGTFNAERVRGPVPNVPPANFRTLRARPRARSARMASIAQRAAAAALPCPGGTTKRLGMVMTSAKLRHVRLGRTVAGSSAATACAAGTYNAQPAGGVRQCAAGTFRMQRARRTAAADGYCHRGRRRHCRVLAARQSEWVRRDGASECEKCGTGMCPGGSTRPTAAPAPVPASAGCMRQVHSGHLPGHRGHDRVRQLHPRLLLPRRVRRPACREGRTRTLPSPS